MRMAGKLRWPDKLTTAGKPGASAQAYGVDTLSHPKSKPWNAWLRTFALDFFSDGRMAVATHASPPLLSCHATSADSAHRPGPRGLRTPA